MTDAHEELLRIATHLDELGNEAIRPDISAPLEKIRQAVTTVEKAFSGSWIGYHAYVYYANLRPAPPGAQFSPEWGLMDRFTIDDTRGDWQQFSPDDVKKHILSLSGNADITAAREFDEKATRAFDSFKSDCLSILTGDGDVDDYLKNILSEITSLHLLTPNEVINTLRPRGTIMTRDSLALTQGYRSPPHVEILAEVLALQHTTGSCKRLAGFARKAGSHLFRKARQNRRSLTVGTNVFIGHGRSPIWKDLKDFIKDRLGLPYDEFNRVPVAGITNIARLSEMLNDAAIAFLVMTGEDETAEGMMNARMNVIHEVGLFQGKLGFTRAIVLLEEGCAEFTNIQGLGQIRFPKGNIGAISEEIRQVLEREGLV